MKLQLQRWSLALFLSATLGIAVGQTTLEPSRIELDQLDQAPFASIGLLEMEVNRSWYRGSAAVAGDHRLVFTCAHNVFDRGRWATNVRFTRAWHDLKDPPMSVSVPLRGYRYHSGYTSAVQRFGDSSASAFAADFAVGFGDESASFGSPLPYLEDGVPGLTTAGRSKKILGYPGELDFSRRSGGYFQHITGPFTSAFRVERGSYLGINRVVTGSGNSGGPVLLSNDGVWSVAGILVSGSRSSAGVFALHGDALQVINEALDAATGQTTPQDPGATFVAQNSKSVMLPDGKKRYTRRFMRFRQLPPVITGAKISLGIRTSYRGDLDVFLRSPRGRVRWLSAHDGEDDQANLILDQLDVTQAFLGTNPNGRWKLFMRDVFKSDRATFEGAMLEVSAR